MRVVKTKWFARFARKEDISDKKLSDAVREAEKGLIDGELGGGLIKKRVARRQGQRGWLQNDNCLSRWNPVGVRVRLP
jgi:hypothetical protein